MPGNVHPLRPLHLKQNVSLKLEYVQRHVERMCVCVCVCLCVCVEQVDSTSAVVEKFQMLYSDADVCHVFPGSPDTAMHYLGHGCLRTAAAASLRLAEAFRSQQAEHSRRLLYHTSATMCRPAYRSKSLYLQQPYATSSCIARDSRISPRCTVMKI